MTSYACAVCGHALHSFLDFGRMPLANGFLRAEEFSGEYFFDLEAGLCPSCGLVQLLRQPAREKMFHGEYPFSTSSSSRMAAHFRGLAERLAGELAPGSFVVEIGSNDGTFLETFAKKGFPHLGVEPAAGLNRLAAARGVRTFEGFFDQDTAARIVKEKGRAELVFAANVFCHLPYLNSVFEGLKSLLSENGRIVFEDPYLGNVLENNSYDQIYDEHFFLFSVSAVRKIAASHGFELTDAEPLWTHGGSMRYFLSGSGKRRVSPRALELMEKEKAMGISLPETFEKFRGRCQESKSKLVALLRRLKSEGSRVAGYAATSKAATVLNYCGIGPDLLECVYDTTPSKQGKYSPGAHIPVRPWEEFSKPYPDYALLFAYNHMDEIMTKESGFMKQGGKWIVFVPHVQVLS